MDPSKSFWVTLQVVFVACFLVLTVQGQTNFIQIDSNQNFVDQYNRTVLFHGINVVYKVPPYYPNLTTFSVDLSLTPQDMQNLQNWGFNAVRLGVMWPGVSPSKGVFNQTYLNTMNQIVTDLGKYGIYSIVDCHQDLISRYFCGEGAPDWTVPKNSAFPFPGPIFPEIPLDQNGYPNITDCLQRTFSKYYFTDAVGNAFQHLYDNVNHFQDYFVDYWQQVTTTFKSNPYVLGYELINEPWAGNIYRDPLYFLYPGKSDKENLTPMYQRLNNAIRAIDDQHIIFFEPAVSDYFESGFSEGPGGPTYNNRQAYSYHIYCGLGDAEGDPNNILICNATDEYLIDVRMQDIKRLGTGHMMTEFGAMEGTAVGLEALDFVMDQADKHIQSWAYWQYKYFDDITTQGGGGESLWFPNGTLDTAKVKILSRTYAQAIAGKPTQQSFDVETGNYALTYTINPAAAKQSTEIYLNEQFYYAKGFTVALSPAGLATYQHSSTNLVVISHNNGATGSLSVTIKPN